MHLITVLLNDEDGFIVSAELVLISTIAVLGMVVGFSQVQNAVVSELNDVGHAIGALNQSYYYSGFSSWKWGGLMKSRFGGSLFWDGPDACDGFGCMIVCDGATPECGVFCGGYGGGFGGVSGGFGGVSGYTSSGVSNVVTTPEVQTTTCGSSTICQPILPTPAATCSPMLAP